MFLFSNLLLLQLGVTNLTPTSEALYSSSQLHTTTLSSESSTPLASRQAHMMDGKELYRPGGHAARTCKDNSVAQTKDVELATDFDYQQQQGSRLLARLQDTDPLFEVCCHTSGFCTAAACKSGMMTTTLDTSPCNIYHPAVRVSQIGL